MSVTATQSADSGLLYTDSEWDFETLQRAYDAIERIALDDLGLNVYPNQVEIISSEQMLDAYSSHGMPLMYQHWSFGKRFARDETLYRRGFQGLAYEIVINSNPCIAYLMEENTMTMQALVMAHASFGHNHFFKNNYLFRQWTDADGILGYLDFAKKYIMRCEDNYGHEEVEEILDAAHAIMDQGVFRYRRRPRLSETEKLDRVRRRLAHDQSTFNDLWRTLPEASPDGEPEDDEDEREIGDIQLPEENLLYFLEKQSPVLAPWQREILRIVRNISQYFYPQKQTKVMNEGCATFVHHYIMNKLHEEGMISDGALMEFLHSHTSVVFQPDFDDPRYSGINPYALGFAMMEDIRRICEAPDAEDREWFPDIAGTGAWREVLRDAWANFRDESFILQYLSPKVMRHFHLFALADDGSSPFYTVDAIHNEEGFRQVREALASMYDLARHEADIQVVGANLAGDRTLKLRHTPIASTPIDEATRDDVMAYVKRLWGHKVELESA